MYSKNYRRWPWSRNDHPHAFASMQPVARVHLLPLPWIRSLAEAFGRSLLGALLSNVWQVLQRLASRYTIWPLMLLRQPVLYRHYANKGEEGRYWREVEHCRRRLQASNANNTPDRLGLLLYYTPALLPVYRETRCDEPEAREEYIAPKTFCKWHRMVFPGWVRQYLPPHSLGHFEQRS